jgi:diguanylate cyclase (GGDEF)-like protein
MGSERRKDEKQEHAPLIRQLTSLRKGTQARYQAFGAQTLRVLLLILLVVSAAGAVLHGIIGPAGWRLDSLDLAIASSVLLAWMLNVLLSGTRLYEASTTVSVIVSVAAILAFTVLNQAVSGAYLLLIPIMISGLFLSVRVTALLSLATMGVLYTIPALVPPISILDLLLGPIAVLSICYSLLLMLLRQRDQIEQRSLAASERVQIRAQEEIKERHEFEQRLIQNAFRDPLTGLPNKALFLDRLRGALLRQARFGQMMSAVMLLDLDDFKDVNDALGHTAGDELLLLIAERLESSLREVDTIARFGGDEFAVLVESIAGVLDAQRAADRMLACLEAPFHVDGKMMHASGSVGVVITWSDYDADAPEDVLRDADIAMYRAKGKGGASSQIFELAMRDQVIVRKEFENELRGALDRREFVLHYQPISSMSTGAIVGFEALLRWKHPVRGMVSPGEFIPIAEATGLIIPIGRWVFHQACWQSRRWQSLETAPKGLCMSVNFSLIQFQQPGFVDLLTDALQDLGVDARLVNVEITESMLGDDPERLLDCLSRLKNFGMGVHLDDFGTGYSSLSQIRELPVDSIKIDRSFVQGLSLHNDHLEITKSIVTMAHKVGLSVIAEGIETAEQFATLRRLGADFGQGFYLSRPYPAEVVEARLLRPPAKVYP